MQLTPQAPQLGRLVGSTQVWPHLIRPELQLKPHTPPEQNGWPPLGAPHTMLHPPQFWVSDPVATHWPLQLVVPLGQLTVQTPLEQTCPAPQAVPQPPQLAVSVCVFTHALPHKLSPPLQVLTQLPVTHETEPPAGGVHVVPQAPQFCTSLEVLTQRPLHLL